MRHSLGNTPHFLQVKAQIVAALKAMTHNLSYGAKVSHILNSNQVWAEFRDQKHDLFITESTTRGYLTGTLTEPPNIFLLSFIATSI